MLGKTNTIFVSKNDASDVQLIQERYLTPSAGSIKKIEYLNNMFFVYTSDKEVMYGTDIGSLAFIKKDGKNLEATHFIYHDGKYYFCNAYEASKLKSHIYATRDFTEYEEIVVEEDDNEDYNLYIPGLFKDSHGRIIIVGYKGIYNSSGDYSTNEQSSLHILKNYGAQQDEEIIRDDIHSFVCMGYRGAPCTDSILIKDRIFSSSGKIVCDLAGSTKNTKYEFSSYVNDYFYRGIYDNYSFAIAGIYKSFDGINWVLCNSVDTKNARSWSVANNKADCGKEVIPLAGNTCLIYSRDDKVYINIADKTNLIGSSSNKIFELDISDLTKITAVTEDGEGNTYIGFISGCIVKLYLDQDGTTQLPDIQVIKTLAAKQALAQAKQYTDEKVAELKAYFDSKIEQNIEAGDVQS